MNWQQQQQQGPVPDARPFQPSRRNSSIETDVWVPVLQAFIIALAWGLAATSGAALLALPLPWPGWTPLPTGLLIGMLFYVRWGQRSSARWFAFLGGGILSAALLFAIVPLPWWLALLPGLGVMVGVFAHQSTAAIQERRDLLWEREVREQRDINDDTVIGKPPRPVVRPFIVRPRAGPPQRANTPVPEPEPVDALEELPAFVEEARRRGLPRPQWIIKGQPRHVLPHNTRVTRSVYDMYINLLREAELIADQGSGMAFVFDEATTDEALAGWLDAWLAGDGVLDMLPSSDGEGEER